jgi:hypothetical protein
MNRQTSETRSNNFAPFVGNLAIIKIKYNFQKVNIQLYNIVDNYLCVLRACSGSLHSTPRCESVRERAELGLTSFSNLCCNSDGSGSTPAEQSRSERILSNYDGPLDNNQTNKKVHEVLIWDWTNNGRGPFTSSQKEAHPLMLSSVSCENNKASNKSRGRLLSSRGRQHCRWPSAHPPRPPDVRTPTFPSLPSFPLLYQRRLPTPHEMGPSRCPAVRGGWGCNNSEIVIQLLLNKVPNFGPK